MAVISPRLVALIMAVISPRRGFNYGCNITPVALIVALIMAVISPRGVALIMAVNITQVALIMAVNITPWH